MAEAKVLAPDEMVQQWQQALPNEVVETFNEMLAQNFDGKTAHVEEKDLLSALRKKGLSAKDVNDQRWLFQTQELYKEAGWKVAYRTPDWEQSFNSYFSFNLK